MTLTDPSPAQGLPAIEVSNLSLSYRVRLAGTSPLDEFKRAVLRSNAHNRVVPAVRDISFDVPRGTTLAIIGRNGAGKSTLLRALAGTLAPDEGRIVARGRVSLLAPGLGMNQRLTGRENILLGGLAVGISRERIESLSEQIGEFAQLDEYLDFPMTAYSAGMRARLGFAVAVHLDPEILLIDEALSGGDNAFANHAKGKMNELCGEGRTIVIVTHGLSSVRTMATDAIWMHQGKIAERGDPDDVINSYMRYCRLEQLEEMDAL